MFENKQIILIHGRADKPRQDILHQLWVRSLVNNLVDMENGLSAAEVLAFEACCKMAYWATIAPFALNDEEEDVERLDACAKRVDDIRKKKGPGGFHCGTGHKFRNFWRDLGADVAGFMAEALTLKDNILEKALDDLGLYIMNQCIASKMRSLLEKQLVDAWQNNREVCIISHSMGTMIAYDVLWRYSHRADTEGYHSKRVNLFVTMGSPLGDATFQKWLMGRHYHKTPKRHFPINIDHWCNFSCLGDVICHDKDLGKEFHSPMRKHCKLLTPDNKNQNSNYVRLYNPYRSRSGKRNPHKSYGYLAQPKLAKWLLKFLRDEMD